MRKIFTLFAAVLMAGSMMAGSLIKFTEPALKGELDGVTFGEDFTLTITDNAPKVERRKVSIDKSDATFGLSEEETISFTHRLKTGGKSSDANKMTLVIPEEGPLVIYARTGKATATDRNFVIRNGSDTIVDHICLDTDTVEGASSKIFLPVIVENVPAGSYIITYPVDGINFYGFQMAYDEPAGPDEYASLSDLINNAGAPAGQEVVVTLTNETIDSLYVSRAGKTNGIYLTAAGHVVEIYCYGVPSEWVAGGTVSGVVTGDWIDSWGTWRLCPSSWNDISYTAPTAPTAVDVTFGNEGFSHYRFQMNDSTWYLRWQGKEQSSETHTLALYRTTNLDSKFGHFTTADFDLTESYFNGDWVGDGVTEIDVTLTETEYGFTMSGYVVAGNGVTYNLAGEYAAPKATPSVTTFTTLSELDGLTITLSGVEVQFAGQDGAIYLTDESLDVLYGEGHNYTFSNNVLTIESFEYVAGEMDPLPEEGKDMLIYTGNVFAGYRDLLLCTIHFNPNPSALENTTATVKAQKVIENGQMVILRDGKKFNLMGAEL